MEWLGHRTDKVVFHLSYDKIEHLVASLCERVSPASIDRVVGIVRGGVLPATIFAQRLGTELHLLRCQRHGTKIEWLGEKPPSGSTILLVDDIVSRGETMQRATTLASAEGYRVMTAAVYVDRSRAAFTPDFAHDTPGFIKFPWDRRETTPDARRRIETSEMLPPTIESDFYCVDMDGIVLPDIRKSYYRKNLPLALKLRHQLSPYDPSNWPDIDWSRAAFVTGRPIMDYQATRGWLDQHGFQQVDVFCRDPETHDATAAGVAAHKATIADRLGASVFIESELLQATLIADRCAALDVIWWGKKYRVKVQASKDVRFSGQR